MTDIQGVLPVLSTPFDAEWGVDRRALKSEIDWLLRHGADGVTIAMVSEILRLTQRERMALTEDVVAITAGRGIVVTSVGAESTDQALALTEHALASGVQAMMANPPLGVTSLPGEQLVAYYCTIADASGDVPLIVQDASGYVGAPVSLDILADLHRRFGAEKIQFKPEAQPLGARLTALLEMTDGTARVFEGNGGLALVDNFRRGIVGSMPGPDLIWALVPLWQGLLGGDEETVYQIQERLSPVLSLVSGLDSYIALEKHLLWRQGVIKDPRQRQPVGYILDTRHARNLIDYSTA